MCKGAQAEGDIGGRPCVNKHNMIYACSENLKLILSFGDFLFSPLTYAAIKSISPVMQKCP